MRVESAQMSNLAWAFFCFSCLSNIKVGIWQIPRFLHNQTSNKTPGLLGFFILISPEHEIEITQKKQKY